MAKRNFENRTLYKGNNLDYLREINSETVDLIATDPPFNKGKDFHATPGSLADGGKFEDRWNWVDDVQPDWIAAIQRDWEGVAWTIEAARKSYGEDMAAFLCWLGVRVIEMHRVLKPTGSIYLHCDATASHYIKQIMDSIFGRKQFQADLIWHRAAENLSRRKYRRASENLLFYTKSQDYTWNGAYTPHSEEYIESAYRFKDARGRYTTTACTNNADRPNMVYEFHGNTRQWRYSRETMEQLEADGLLVFNKRSIPRRKLYLSDSPGVAVSTVWDDIGVLQSRSAERTGYPTQKPVALYERIIEASSNAGDFVLDPFCGCATTPIAAEKLGRQWIGMDLWDGAHNCVLERLEQEGLASPDAPTREGAQRALLTFDDVIYTETPPVRERGSEAAVPFLPTPSGKRPRAAWQRLTNKDMVRTLADAQRGNDGDVVCAGCGRGLPEPYFDLDHREPKSGGGEDWITNRVLLCGPCNGRKQHRLALVGLREANGQPDGEGRVWMVSREAAVAADKRAQDAARAVRDG